MTFPGFSEPTTESVTSATTRLHEQIAEKDNQIVQLQNAVHNLRNASRAHYAADLKRLVEEGLDHLGTATINLESDEESITVHIEGLGIDRAGNITPPVRDWLIEGTITIPVSFVVTAANETEAEDLGIDALRTISYDADDHIPTPLDHDVSDFGCGQGDYDLDGVSEN